jgi:triacylglycerol esterase/lipase EstA (alpha/beta hydrolase family)
MLARLVLISLLLEIAAWAAIGAWLHAARGWPIATVILAGVAVMLFARLALVCFTSFLGWLRASPRATDDTMPLSAVPSYVAREWAAVLLDNFWYLPFERFALRTDPVPSRCERLPVILVHGYLSNRGYFKPLVDALESDPRVGPVFTPNFPVLATSIEHFADELHAAVESIATGCGHGKVILVCHSMGGLATREYLRTRGAARIARVVTIASPHHGTDLASMGMGLNARQMARGSEFLRRLEAAESANPPAVPTTSIYTPHDNLVAPQETSRLPWARNVTVPGVGHVSIIASPRTFALVRAELAG